MLVSVKASTHMHFIRIIALGGPRSNRRRPHDPDPLTKLARFKNTWAALRRDATSTLYTSFNTTSSGFCRADKEVEKDRGRPIGDTEGGGHRVAGKDTNATEGVHYKLAQEPGLCTATRKGAPDTCEMNAKTAHCKAGLCGIAQGVGDQAPPVSKLKETEEHI